MGSCRGVARATPVRESISPVAGIIERIGAAVKEFVQFFAPTLDGRGAAPSVYRALSVYAGGEAVPGTDF
jgi:hypothetical protein